MFSLQLQCAVIMTQYVLHVQETRSRRKVLVSEPKAFELQRLSFASNISHTMVLVWQLILSALSVKQVLFKSCHQGCKVDVWSAGVTLLYLIIGKAPFGGDPEQWVLVNLFCRWFLLIHLIFCRTIYRNIKEIAKLRGSEDLWEVAKLHNRESSYPAVSLLKSFIVTFIYIFVKWSFKWHCFVPAGSLWC